MMTHDKEFYKEYLLKKQVNMTRKCHNLTLTFSRNSIINTTRVSNGFDPYQDRHPVSPDLGPNCLQRLSVDNNKESKERVNLEIC